MKFSFTVSCCRFRTSIITNYLWVTAAGWDPPWRVIWMSLIPQNLYPHLGFLQTGLRSVEINNLTFFATHLFGKNKQRKMKIGSSIVFKIRPDVIVELFFREAVSGLKSLPIFFLVSIFLKKLSKDLFINYHVLVHSSLMWEYVWTFVLDLLQLGVLSSDVT